MAIDAPSGGRRVRSERVDTFDETVREAWVDASAMLGGDEGVARVQAEDLLRRYRRPSRSYHDVEHIAAVLANASDLAYHSRLAPQDVAAMLAAACAHDVVYLGRAGEDERSSAAWAADALTAAGVAPPLAERVRDLVLSTAEHRSARGDLAAAILLDADLSVLGRDPAGYAEYVAAVRTEYADVDDERWRTGRSALLRDLLARPSLFATRIGHDRWEAAARANMSAELSALSASAPPAD